MGDQGAERDMVFWIKQLDEILDNSLTHRPPEQDQFRGWEGQCLDHKLNFIFIIIIIFKKILAALHRMQHLSSLTRD